MFHPGIHPVASTPTTTAAVAQLYECLSCGERRTIKNRGESIKCRNCDFRILLKVQSKKNVCVVAR